MAQHDKPESLTAVSDDGQAYDLTALAAAGLPPVAIALLQRGCAIIPVNRGKRPLTKWKTFETRQPSQDELLTWLSQRPAGWALVTGERAGIIVLDFDGDAGVAWLVEWQIAAHVETPSGGAHVYATHPGWHVATLNAKSDGWLAEHYHGVDIRADGGYVLVAGQVDVEGGTTGTYTWLRTPTPEGLAAIVARMPGDLVEHFGLARPPAEPVAITAPAPREPVALNGYQRRDVAERVLAYGLKQLRSGIGRDNAAFLMALQARDNGMTQSEAEGLGAAFLAHAGDTNTKGKLERFDLDDFTTKARSAYSRPARDAWSAPTVAVHVQTMPTPTATPTPTPEPASSLSADTIWKCYQSDEHGDAMLFEALYSGWLLYDPDEKAWYVFGPHHWRRDQRDVAKHAVPSTVAAAYIELAAQIVADVDAETDPDRQKAKREQADALNKRAKQLRGLVRTKHVVEYAQGLLSAKPDDKVDPASEWDAQRHLLGVANGVLDLVTLEFREGRPEDRIRTAIPTEWHGIDAPAPRWERFVREIMAEDDEGNGLELTSYLQRLLGYSLSASSAEHVLPILCGADGRNGKDTLLESLAHVLGPIAEATSTSVLLTGRYDDPKAASPYTAELQGKRLVWASETTEKNRLSTSAVKYLTGGGRVRARHLFSKPVSFDPTHLVVLVTNRKPQAPSDDQALWSRIHVIEFTRRFVDEPKLPHERKRVPKLADTLTTEAPGILAWLVRGLLDWRASGLNPPAAVRLASEKYRLEQDELDLFVRECCVEGADKKAKASDLLRAFVTWSGHDATQKELGAQLVKRYAKEKTAKGVFYVGLGLLSDQV